MKTIKQTILLCLLWVIGMSGYAQTGGADFTSYITNPQYKNGQTGWTNGGTVNYNCMEKFSCNFNVYQIISGLPSGKYSIGVQAFYRAGQYSDDTSANNAIIYAEGNGTTFRKPVMHITANKQYSSITSWEIYINGGYVPNEMPSASDYFSAGLYHNTLEAEVGADGKLKIGIKKETLINCDWTIWTNWTLTRGTYFRSVDNVGNHIDQVVSEGDKVAIDDTSTELSIFGVANNVDVNYSRTFKNTNWQAWYMPFGFTITDDISSKFSFAKFAGTYTEDGKFYITLVELHDGDVVNANTPYFICAKTASSTPQIISVRNTSLMNTETRTLHMLSAEKAIDITGTYAKKVAVADDDWYAYGGGSYIKASEGQNLGAFRFFLTIRDREDGPYISTPNPTEIKVIVLNDDASDINTVSDTQSSRANAQLFNLSGQIVSDDYKGIVIKNGKKIFIK